MKTIITLIFLLFLSLSAMANSQRDYIKTKLIDMRITPIHSDDTAFDFVVMIDGIRYDSRFIRRSKLQQNPKNEFIVNDPIDVSLDVKRNVIYIKRTNGWQLKTKIIRKERVDN